MVTRKGWKVWSCPHSGTTHRRAPPIPTNLVLNEHLPLTTAAPAACGMFVYELEVSNAKHTPLVEYIAEPETLNTV